MRRIKQDLAIGHHWRRVFAWAAMVCFVAISVLLRGILPEFIFRDAEKIQTQIEGGSDYAGTSFDAVARIYAFLGAPLTQAFVLVVGCLLIYLIVRQADRVSALAVGLVLCVPCVFYNLFVASKDTIVVAMAVSLVILAKRRGGRQALVATIALYLAYALFIRSYFALIAALSVGVFYLTRFRSSVRLIWISAFVGLICFAPDGLYFQMMHSRDLAVDYLQYGSEFGARTSFYNLYPPTSIFAFGADYVYAFARLNFPIFFGGGLKELFLAVFVSINLLAVARSLRCTNKFSSQFIFGCFLAAHIAVCALFEPDLGSYLRHLSSVALFCWLALRPDECIASKNRGVRPVAHCSGGHGLDPVPNA